MNDRRICDYWTLTTDLGQVTDDVFRPDRLLMRNRSRNVSCGVMENRQNVDDWRIRDVFERYRLVGLGNDHLCHRYHQMESQSVKSKNKQVIFHS